MEDYVEIETRKFNNKRDVKTKYIHEGRSIQINRLSEVYTQLCEDIKKTHNRLIRNGILEKIVTRVRVFKTE